MHNHAPADYHCPICLAIQGVENEHTWIKQTDIFHRDELVFGFISSKSLKGNEGHPIIVPLEHFENFYDLPAEYGHRIFEVGQKVAVALKEIRKCDGVTILQNNEPAGDQHAFHYHFHVFPRYSGDTFREQLGKPRVSDPSERVEHAAALRKYFAV
ncbi:MAG: HIT family protein [Patescibacteria group bacterium]